MIYFNQIKGSFKNSFFLFTQLYMLLKRRYKRLIFKNSLKNIVQPIKVYVSILLLLSIAFFSCKKIETARPNQIAYTVYSALDLPLDTINYFNIQFLNENEELISIKKQHRFTYSYTVTGAGKTYIEAQALDSIPIVAVISQNGIKIAEQKGLEIKIEKEFK
jgi:hypothetical protein